MSRTIGARRKPVGPDLRFHDLRHSGAVLAAMSGATLAELMARLGHSTPTAALIYQHAAKGRDREIAALLSKLAEQQGIVMARVDQYLVVCGCGASIKPITCSTTTARWAEC